jgi:hypothetical protein
MNSGWHEHRAASGGYAFTQQRNPKFSAGANSTHGIAQLDVRIA